MPIDEPHDVFAGGGEAGAIFAGLDWRGHRLAEPGRWPQSLRTALGICLASRHPICILWGRDYTYLYNDAYAPIVGSKHPAALGAAYPQVWPEIWESDIRPVLEPVMATGIASWADNLLPVLQRYGYNEECYFSFFFAPIRDESGQVGGVFTAITETTPQVVGQRRLTTLSDLGARTAEATTVEDAIAATVGVLAHNPRDIPFATIYLLEREGNSVRLAGQFGVSGLPARLPQRSDIACDAEWGFAQVAATEAPVPLAPLPAVLADIPARPWPDIVTRALVLRPTGLAWLPRLRPEPAASVRRRVPQLPGSDRQPACNRDRGRARLRGRAQARGGARRARPGEDGVLQQRQPRVPRSPFASRTARRC